MYISPETHDALCNAGAWGICAMFGAFALILVLPRFILLLRFAWARVKIDLFFLRCRIVIYVRYRRALARLKRDERRYKAAMKVFDKPLVRWSEDGVGRLQ